MFNFILNTTAISGLDLLHLQIHTNMVANRIGIAYFGLLLHDEGLSGKRNSHNEAARVNSSLIFFMI
jgi:hypothetical protein